MKKEKEDTEEVDAAKDNFKRKRENPEETKDYIYIGETGRSAMERSTRD